MGGSKTSLIDPIIDIVVDVGVDLLDGLAQSERIVVIGALLHCSKGAVEHAEYIGRFVTDDGLLHTVPEQGHRDATGVIGIGFLIELIEKIRF